MDSPEGHDGRPVGARTYSQPMTADTVRVTGSIARRVKKWVEVWEDIKDRGRPRAGYHQEWAERFRLLFDEATEEHQFNCVDGEAPPGKLEICFEIAVGDFKAHPERW